MMTKKICLFISLLGVMSLLFSPVTYVYGKEKDKGKGFSVIEPATPVPDVEAALYTAISAVQKDPSLKYVGAPILPKKVRVAVVPIPPFAFQSEEGRWEGISIEIWEAISRRWGIESTYIDTTVEEAEKGLETGRYEVGLGGIPVVSGASKKLDFSLPYYVDTVGIGSYETKTDVGLAYLDLLFSWNFMKAALAVIVFILVGAFLIYIFERGKSSEFPTSDREKGLGNAMWWCCGTFTTVGSSVELSGVWSRAIAFIYMCISVLAYSALLGGVTSVLTVTQLSSPTSPQGLGSAKLEAVKGGVAAQALTEQMIPFRSVPNLREAFERLASGASTHLVYAESALLFLKNTDISDNKNLADLPKPTENFMVQSTQLGIQYFSFVYPKESPLRPVIDRDVLLLINLPQWKQIIYRYLGSSGVILTGE